MDYKKIYRGGMTCEQFLFFEMRTTASMLLEMNDRDEIYNMIKEQNLYQLPTERTVKRIFNTCIRRIDLMGSDTLTRTLANASVDVAKQINLYAMMLDNGIVMDFMTDVIAEKYINQDLSFSKNDVNMFLFELQENVDEVSVLSDSTIAKIRQVLIRSLVECGYIEKTSSKKLNFVYLFPELEEAIRAEGNTDLLPAFNHIQ